MFDLKAHLKTLVETHAPSGHEAPIREVIRDAWDGLVDEFDQDKLGSLIGIKKATNPPAIRRKIMLSAHMDEIGYMVRDIRDGFIFVQRVAGMDNRVMLAQLVLVHGRETLKGIVATTPPHLLTASDRKKYPSHEALVIDVGLPHDEVTKLVRIGDLVTPDVDMIELAGKHVAAKAFDDRACVAAVTGALHHLQSMSHSWDVYASATIQEESGLIGATTAAHRIDPDIAIALDVTFAQQSGVKADDSVEMNKGVAIAIGGNIHPMLVDKVIEVAETHEIPHLVEPIVGNTGTDAWAIQVAREGIPTVLFSIPIRNMHSPVETLNMNDVERTSRLLAHFIASLDDDFLQTIVYDDVAKLDEQA